MNTDATPDRDHPMSTALKPGTAFRYRYSKRAQRPLRIVEQIGTSNRFIVECLDGTHRRETSSSQIVRFYEEIAE